MKSIFEYLDYRQFLRDHYAEKKAVGKLSIRSFAQRAGNIAFNYLKLVMDGERNLSEKTIPKFAKALDLTREEAEFFHHLVLMNQAPTHEVKNRHYRKMSTLAQYLEVKHLEKDQYEFLSKWYYVAIREMTLLPGFREDAAWIGKLLKPALPAAKVREALDFLLRLGLLVRGEDGRLSPSNHSITTGSEVAHLASCNYHVEMLKTAAQHVMTSKPQHREFSGMTVAMSKEKFDAVKKRLREFRREIHAMVSGGDDPDAVYQINLQLFPLNEVAHENA